VADVRKIINGIPRFTIRDGKEMGKGWGVGLLCVVGCEGLRGIVVRIPVSGQRRIPSWSLVREILDNALGQIHVRDAVRMGSCGRVVRVRTICAVDDGLETNISWTLNTIVSLDLFTLRESAPSSYL
jgi:hypothetical protein